MTQWIFYKILILYIWDISTSDEIKGASYGTPWLEKTRDYFLLLMHVTADELEWVYRSECTRVEPEHKVLMYITSVRLCGIALRVGLMVLYVLCHNPWTLTTSLWPRVLAPHLGGKVVTAKDLSSDDRYARDRRRKKDSFLIQRGNIISRHCYLWPYIVCIIKGTLLLKVLLKVTFLMDQLLSYFSVEAMPSCTTYK